MKIKKSHKFNSRTLEVEPVLKTKTSQIKDKNCTKYPHNLSCTILQTKKPFSLSVITHSLPPKMYATYKSLGKQKRKGN